MTRLVETPAERIAADLALAIHQGHIPREGRLPSQSHLVHAYGVATATVSSALAKLAAAGLTRGEPGRGTFVRKLSPFDSHPALDVLAAASVCRSVSSAHFGASKGTPTIPIGGSTDWGTAWEDEETMPPRQLDVSALAVLDRHVLRWMSEAFFMAARLLVGSGPSGADDHLIAAARAILRDGGRRPEGQPGIAHHGGATPPEEDIVLRIWPERAAPRDPGGPPF